nr:HAD family phosphatase [uncultured Lachnoclostridium sp.]
MIQGAIFDMDGLMFDTERLSNEGWLQAAKELNYPITAITVAKIRGTNIATSKQIFKKEFGNTVDFEAALDVQHRYIDKVIEENGVPVKPGLFVLLKYLKENGIKLAVATSTARERAERFLKKALVYEYFDTLAFGDEVKNGKPAPDIFLLAAEKLSLHPENCVVFEDSPHGIKAAYGAKTKVIGVQDLAEFDETVYKMLNYDCKTLSDAIPLIKTL